MFIPLLSYINKDELSIGATQSIIKDIERERERRQQKRITGLSNYQINTTTIQNTGRIIKIMRYFRNVIIKQEKTTTREIDRRQT